MIFQWLTRPFYALLRRIMHKNDVTMRIFTDSTDPTNARMLLNNLSENLPFLKYGIGNILVTRVDYCKCKRGKGGRWEHEFLLVTAKERVGAKRSAYFLVDRLMDNAKEYPGGPDGLVADIERHQNEEMVELEETPLTRSHSTAESETSSNSPPPGQQWAAMSSFQRSGDPPNALDRLVILPNLKKNTVVNVIGKSSYDVLMVMDLTRSQNNRSVPIESFADLVLTTSTNTPRYHHMFIQCYWFAYTIWHSLDIETGPQISAPGKAERQCTYSGYGRRVMLGKGNFVNMVRSPETIRAKWEAERAGQEQRWAERQQAVNEDAERCREAEAALQELQAKTEEVRREFKESQAQNEELRRKIERYKLAHPLQESQAKTEEVRRECEAQNEELRREFEAKNEELRREFEDYKLAHPV